MQFRHYHTANALEPRRYVLTGTSGAGKTSLLRCLEISGHVVVEEAATDVIALEQAQGISEPWADPTFIDRIIALQKQRQQQSNLLSADVQYFDRSPLDTFALSLYLNYAPSPSLLDELERIQQEQIYKTQVFFIENLGVCQPSEARKISFEEALRFEKIHEDVYRSWGYECIKIAPGTVSQRAENILGRQSDEKQRSTTRRATL